MYEFRPNIQKYVLWGCRVRSSYQLGEVGLDTLYKSADFNNIKCIG